MTKRTLPHHKLEQKNSVATFTYRYEFYLLDNTIYVRDKRYWHVSPQWMPLLFAMPHLNLSPELKKILENKEIIAITADEGNLNIIHRSGRVYYAKLDSFDGVIEWIEDWGLVNKFLLKPRIIYADPKRYLFVSASHVPPYKGRPDSKNVIQGTLFGISSLSAYDLHTGLIVSSDPWWRSEFSQCLVPPNGLRVIGKSESASMHLVATVDGLIHTILWDFDTGTNALFRQQYSLESMEHRLHPETQQRVDFSTFSGATGLSPQMTKDFFRKRNLPITVWQNHPLPDGFKITGAVTILQNGPNTRDDFTLRVWGYQGKHYGFITKQITATSWVFKLRNKSRQPEAEIIPEVAAIPHKNLVGRLGFWGRSSTHYVHLTIDEYNPYKDYNRISVRIGAQHYPLYLFTNHRVHLNHTSFSKGIVLLSSELKNSTDPLVNAFVRDYFGREDTQTFTLRRDEEHWTLSAEKLRFAHPTKPLKLTLQELPDPNDDANQMVRPNTA